jgi:tetratricopeptide (TPR) repeat protein
LKCFPNLRWLRLCGVGLCVTAAGWMISARGELPSWIRNIEAGSALEAAFFRAMQLPGGMVLYRRPPAETRPALGELIKSQANQPQPNNEQPSNADLYSLRALEDEQQLDFSAAESDWKKYVESAPDKASAQLALADFYHRRVRPLDEIKTLSVVANSPADAADKLTAPAEQRSWQAFERIFNVIRDQGLPQDSSLTQYRAWLARYPREQSLSSRFLDFLVAQKDYAAATQLVADYHKQFPGDEVFPVKAKAMVEYRRGSLQQGLEVYEQSFQPLWAPELVKSYFDLLTQTQSLRKFLDGAQAALNANPEDLNAMARVFYYYQQQGKLDAAQQTVTAFRLHKEARHSDWSGQELYVCARLLQDIHAYPESARYYFALYNSKGMNDAQEPSLAALTDLLLSAPESPVQLGSGQLSMYRDIATMDQGPGYLNGILSLILNTTAPASQFSQEEQRAVPYFHRSRAAELLKLLDTKFPTSTRRPELHAKLLEFYASSAESEAVIQGGREFLSSFPNAPHRTAVSLLMADAYSRTRKAQEEFAIYDAVLQELATRAERIPLGQVVAGGGQVGNSFREAAPEDSREEGENRSVQSGAFEFGQPSAATQLGARSPEYARVLERYLARLVQLKQIPEALAVLRREIDRNPDDPGLYERLAVFLDQNRLGAEQEEVYRRAMARFPERSWYDKLARFYLRYKKNAEFEKLTQEAVKAFSGADLELYFASVGYGGTPALYLRLNQYANQRFPHNPVFVQNLLNAYHTPTTYDDAAWQALLRMHWFEAPDLRSQFFEYLSRGGMLESELQALEQNAPTGQPQWGEFAGSNPAAAEFIAQAELWRSHFEASASPLKALAEIYPADFETGRTASSVYRSLAYFDPGKTALAVRIEDNLLQASPGNTEIMARIGDIYADRDLFPKAAPYWNRIPQVAPGQSAGYLEAASIYWDYFDFDNALRLLREGRKRLGDENLYRYEAGAIYENQRDYSHAIAEYIQGALAVTSSPADLRLMELARRPNLRGLADQETARLVSSPAPSMPAVDLRVRVLEAQDRRAEMESFLESVVQGTTSIEQAVSLETLAEQRSLESVREHALEKEAALTIDPVTRLQLRYRLVQLYENRKDFQSAQRNVEALYHENPRILGVVRSTVDFDWRMKMYPQAIAVLLQSAKDAYPELGKQFAFEAARKSTEAKQYAQARDLLSKLLSAAPYDGQYLAAMADTYAQAGDDAGLRQFYLDKIALFRNAPFSGDERKARIATLRRGLIPALSRMKDYSGAVDQYIELINNFPEDGGLVTEAALYALRYQKSQPLVDFYSKTVAQSPRDYRWPMVLAQIYTSMENFPAAIENYAKAIAIRPDRVDLRLGRAGLEERLMRFDDAAADYERVYQLAYKDPKWMEKVAEVRARQGRADDVVAALKAALVDGRPESAGKYFEVARRLESWGMLSPARTFAERGVETAGADLLATTEQQSGVNLYARIMTRLRQQEKAYTTLQSSLAAASSVLPVIQEQVARQGIAAITDREWRERTQENRIRNARDGMRTALSEMGSTVALYFSPEAKAAFASFAETKRTGMSFADVQAFAVPLAQSAGLAELESRLRYQLMMEPEQNSGVLMARMEGLAGLQRRRLKFAELGSQLEQFAPRVEPQQRYSVWVAAADAYRSANDPENEMRVLGQVPPAYLGRDAEQQLLKLLLSRRPQELVQRASFWNSWGQDAADFVVASGDAKLAHAVVEARGRVRTPVWSNAYDALVGLYFAEPTPAVNGTFLSILGDHVIGDRLAKPVNRAQEVAGNIWFYYGSRYGEYASLTKQNNPEDFIPAILEQSPGTASAYLTLADYYMESGDPVRAISDYEHTLELAPARADVHDRLAMAYSQRGARTEALAQWKQVFSLLKQQIDSAHVPESFWSDFGRACDHLRAKKAFNDLKPDVDSLLRAYLRRNGNYRSNALLHSAYVDVADPSAATTWLLDLASVAPDPSAVLGDVVEASWIPLTQREPIYQRILEAKQQAAAKAVGLEKEGAQQVLRSWQIRWIQYLVSTREYGPAGDALAALPKDTRDLEATTLVPLELQVAAKTGTLDSKIEGYRADPQTAPGSDVLRAAARQLFEAGDKQSARKVLEFVFTGEIEEHKLVAANFLGLAEIRIAAGDTQGAVELLRRLVVAVGNPFENLDPVAALLEKTGHNAEAIEFLQQLVKSAPWEADYRLRLAKAQMNITAARGPDTAGAQNALIAIASGAENAYNERARATMALTGVQGQAELGSKELNLLAGSRNEIPAPPADQPYFYEARVKAAQSTSDARAKIRLLGDALADTPARDDARIPLFRAAASVRSDELALGAIQPLLHQQFFSPPTAPVLDDEEITGPLLDQPGSEDEAGDQDVPIGGTSAIKLTASQQAQLAWTLGEVMVHLDRLNEGMPYLQLARKLEKTPGRRKEISSRIDDVRARLRRQQVNAARQPILHEALEQDRVVRPRLLARAAPPGKAAAKGSVKP